MTIYRHRLASSFYALRKTLEARLARIKGLNTDLPDDERLEENLPEDEQAFESLAAEEAADLEAKALTVEEEG